MKILLLLTGILFSRILGNRTQLQNLDECTEELGISKETMKEGLQEDQDKHMFDCLMACVMKKDGVLEEGKKINEDILKKTFSKHLGDNVEEAIKIYMDCVDKAKTIDDECEFVDVIHQCLIEKAPERLRDVFKQM